ncbi:DoxX family protein [Streptomonospora wellingtoniae]|uniref:DoxX family protein n=1 Tax=Streptomonospora wellingtoniae TaxID=3075544 RepID=A0ABU2KNN0_9ACTN|nr:DoxX family protein [Streptomonospora sp. DSM 45055]MDT0300872.1 DoxX family protein [Streptomonospora sp. DSM 45055]
MDLALWIVAGLLALAFGAGGALKIVVPKEKIITVRTGRWAEDWSPGAIKAIGALEVLAAAGLVLPAALGVAPVLVPLAAVGLVLVMAGAIIVHARRGEGKQILGNLVYVVLAAFVAWGRFNPAPPIL